MKDIPATGIYYDDALAIVFQMITPDWQILEERLNPSSPYYDKFPERDAKEGANREAHRAYDKAQRLAHEWLQERIGRGILVALRRDPDTGEILQLDRHKNIFQYGPTSGGHPVYFDRKSFNSLLNEPNRTSTASKNNSNLQLIRDVCNQLWPDGYKGKAKERDEEIRQEFKRRGRKKPSVRSIQRALKSD